MAFNKKLVRQLTKDFIVPWAKEMMRPDDRVVIEKDENGRTTMRGRPFPSVINYPKRCVRRLRPEGRTRAH